MGWFEKRRRERKGTNLEDAVGRGHGAVGQHGGDGELHGCQIEDCSRDEQMRRGDTDVDGG